MTVKEAALATGRSVDIIRRRLRDDAFPRARQGGPNPNDPWRIPERDLLGAGLLITGLDDLDSGTVAAIGAGKRPDDFWQQLAAKAAVVAELRDQVQWLRHSLERSSADATPKVPLDRPTSGSEPLDTTPSELPV